MPLCFQVLQTSTVVLPPSARTVRVHGADVRGYRRCQTRARCRMWLVQWLLTSWACVVVGDTTRQPSRSCCATQCANTSEPCFCAAILATLRACWHGCLMSVRTCPGWTQMQVSGGTGGRLPVFEKVPAHLAWILEQDRGVSISDRDREGSTLVVVVGAEKKGTNVAPRTRVALEIATCSLHAPLLYEGCRIHLPKRVLP